MASAARASWLPLRAAALAAVLGACAPVDDAIDAFHLLQNLQAGMDAAEPASGRRVVTWTHRDAPIAADLYSPPAPRGALVLMPGLGREGRRDPRVVVFAQALREAQFAVMVPDVPNFQAQRVSAADGELAADAIRDLLARPEGRGPVGVAGVSYAVGPAVLAALSPDLAPRIDFVVAIGGYFDTVSAVTFFTTGFFREDSGAPWRRGVPNAYGKWVFVLANAERLENARDRTTLMAMARRKLDDLDADIADLTVGLGPEGRAVVDLLANRDPDRVPRLIAALPSAVRTDLAGLNLAGRGLERLRADFILIHGRDDAIIPYTETLALARAVPDAQAHVALLDSLAHADLGPGGLIDALRLWRAAYALMRARR